MKKILIALLIAACIASPAFAAWDKTKPGDNEKLVDTPAQLRANWDAIELGTDAALQITNAKVAASAAIADTKLATISTAGKVSGAALTSLTSVPSGAGALPVANIPTSIPDTKLSQLTTADKVANSALVAITTAGKVDGAALTGFASIPSGAGKIPVANIDTGTTANKIIILDGDAKLPAVDGSALTNLPIPSVISSLVSDFGGSGAAGNITLTTGSSGVPVSTNFSTIDSPQYILQADDFTLGQYDTLVVNEGFAFIFVAGDCTITGTITAAGQGANGGATRYHGENALGGGTEYRYFATGWPTLTAVSARAGIGVGGAGGGGGTLDSATYGWGGGGGGGGGLGGTVGGAGEATPAWKTLLVDAAIERDTLLPVLFASRGGGGGGGGGRNSGTPGPGGKGGGVIYIEVAGALVFDGSITAAGAAGSDGYMPGGGGGGGTVIIRAKTITTNTGTVSVAAGATGGSGAAAGAAGYSKIVDVP